MKELSIEEKAKAYDEALERARKEYKNHEAFNGFREMLIRLFPELKESKEYNEVEPIPLTPEILEKNGFVKFISSQYTLPNCSAAVILVTIEGMPSANGKWMVAIKNGYTDAKIAITYVHELQQALKLCKIEKEIIL